MEAEKRKSLCMNQKTFDKHKEQIRVIITDKDLLVKIRNVLDDNKFIVLDSEEELNRRFEPEQPQFPSHNIDYLAFGANALRHFR